MTETIKANDAVELTLRTISEALKKEFKSEIIFIRAPMYKGLDNAVRIEVERIVSNSNGTKRNGKLPRLTVFLETDGGYIEVVERISDVFRNHFREVDFVVPSHAYSAGTVLVLSGDRIFMDYYSVLGPVDPQIEDDKGNFIPGMGYLYKYNELIKKSKSPEGLSDAEILFLTKRFDPGVMFVIEQAKNHSEELIKAWLPKYKFKHWKVTGTKKLKVTAKMRKERAGKIAEILGDASRWHSHGRGISIRDLTSAQVKLLVDDFGSNKQLNHFIRQYHDLFIDYCAKVGANYAIHSVHGIRNLGV